MINSFGLPPSEAMAFFQAKGLKTSFAWQDMLHDEHGRAFTVAKMMDMSLLADVKAAVDAAIAEGKTLEDFKKGLEPLLQEKGWWGRQTVIDPVTGEETDAQLGSPRRLKTIFETNLKTAYARGHWEQIKATADSAPYLLYDAIKDDRTREEHLAWDGIVLRWDDPWWKTHFPPNGWNCRCHAIQLDKSDMVKLGKSEPDQTPPSGTFTWVNPRTGEELQVPDGIDPGWAYNPGAVGNEDITEALMEKIGAVPADIGSEAFVALPEEQKRDIADTFETWAEAIIEGKENAQGVIKPVGVIEPEVVAELEKMGQAVSTALINISDRVLQHMVRDAKAKIQETGKPSGKVLPVDQIMRLPEILNDPQAILWDLEDPALIYAFDLSEYEKMGKLVIRVNLQTKVKGKDGKKVKTTINTIVTGGMIPGLNLQDKRRYKALKGKP